MQQEHGGVTLERKEFFDNPDAALDISRRVSARYREVNLDSEQHRASIVNAEHDEKGRPIITLPDRSTDCDPELVDKSPEAMAEILKARSEADHSNTVAIMQDYPGKSDGMKHHSSSSAGKRHHKPKPSFDHTKASIHDAADVVEVKRPHPVTGRVSTEALVGLSAQTVSAGSILDAIGKALYAGTSWAKIEFVVSGLAVNG
jgi:hypothetical protein